MSDRNATIAPAPGSARKWPLLLFVVNAGWFILSRRLAPARAAPDAGAEAVVAAGDDGRAEEIRRYATLQAEMIDARPRSLAL